MQLLILIFVTLGICTAAPTNDKEIKDAITSVRALMKPLLPGSSNARPKGTGNFRVDGCEKHKVNWMDVILMKTTVTLTYTFKDGCDIEGSITPKLLQEFQANLNLRNLESYNRIESVNKINASIESKPVMKLEMRAGKLAGKNTLKFEADYSVQLNPLNKNPVDKNLGGEIRISEINGRSVAIKEKIMID